jgi:hypothetical protein
MELKGSGIPPNPVSFDLYVNWYGHIDRIAISPHCHQVQEIRVYLVYLLPLSKKFFINLPQEMLCEC